MRPPKYRKMKRKGERTKVYLQKKPLDKPKNYFFKEKASSYLKYLRVVRMYIQKKYELSLSELELLLFLYDETVFDKDTFYEYACTLGFSTMNWLQKFEDREIIRVWREGNNSNRMYTLTHKYKMVCNKMYEHLEGKPISNNPQVNPLMKSNASFSDKMYSRIIKRMNDKRKGVE